MTIAETTSQTRNNYTGNGSTTVFPFTFIVLEESNQALNRDYTIKVILTENDVETVQQENTDYTVQLGTDGLGTVTFTTAPTATQSITFLSEIPRTQSTDYINIGTDKFPANSHEGTVDKLTLISREQDEAIDRSILLPESSTLTNVTIPVSTENADKAIVVNGAGDDLTAKNLADIGTAPVTDFAKTLLDDNNASEARTTLDAQEDVITTQGDIIVGNVSGEAERLPVGTAGQILQSNGTNPVWSSDLVINNKLNTQPNTATISSGAITYTNTYMVVDTEASASTDDLDTINGGSVGDILIIRQENDGRDITFKHAGGNINLTNGIEFSFVNTRDRLVLQYDGSFWVELSRSLDVEIRHSIDYDNGVSKSYNTIYQASEAGYLVIQLAGSFRNVAQLLVGSASPPTTQVGIWGDDINGNTKAVSASYPISKGTYYKIAPATIGVSSDAWETVDFKFYPIKPS